MKRLWSEKSRLSFTDKQSWIISIPAVEHISSDRGLQLLSPFPPRKKSYRVNNLEFDETSKRNLCRKSTQHMGRASNWVGHSTPSRFPPHQSSSSSFFTTQSKAILFFSVFVIFWGGWGPELNSSNTIFADLWRWFNLIFSEEGRARGIVQGTFSNFAAKWVANSSIQFRLIGD